MEGEAMAQITDALDEREIEELQAYFDEHLPQYEIEAVEQKRHPEDWYLFCVVARHRSRGDYAVSTSWKTSTGSLNHGHYDIDRDTAYSNMEEYL
jgi:hypothetical protein